jgi:prepilin-type N-terminal cleavage/methylation domain-containing protein
MKIPLQHQRGDAQRGFTLLELMLALAILAIVLIMIMSSFNVVIHSKIQGEAHLTVDRQGRAILWELANEIRGAVQTPDPISNVMFVGAGQTGGRAAVDSITISTLAAGHRRAITGLDAEQLVSYAMTPNPSTRGWYILTRTQRSGLLVGNSSFVPPATQLADNIVSLHLKYFNGNSWLESWDSTALPPPTQLPIAVSIDLVLGTDNGHVMNFSTEVVLPMAVQVW